jgi:hypothetical protein
VTGSVTGTGGSIGGLVGVNSNGVVINNYTTNTVTGNSNVGGLIGSNSVGVGTINNSIALNPSVTTGLTAVGRIAGSGSGLTNNLAWVGMSINITIVNDANGLDGLSMTAADIKDSSTWVTVGFSFGGYSDASPWVWEAGKMPRLYWETAGTDWPVHLSNTDQDDLDSLIAAINLINWATNVGGRNTDNELRAFVHNTIAAINSFGVSVLVETGYNYFTRLLSL